MFERISKIHFCTVIHKKLTNLQLTINNKQTYNKQTASIFAGF